MMVLRFFDKLIFGCALLIALQMPNFITHYQQFLSGYFEKTKSLVEDWTYISAQNDYKSLEAMIDHHLKNDVPSVREEAKLKQDTLDEYHDLVTAMALFKDGNIFEKTLYILNPSREKVLLKTLDNYKPGIPISVTELVFGFVIGIFLNLVVVSPVYLAKYLYRRRKNALIGSLR